MPEPVEHCKTFLNGSRDKVVVIRGRCRTLNGAVRIRVNHRRYLIQGHVIELDTRDSTASSAPHRVPDRS